VINTESQNGDDDAGGTGFHCTWRLLHRNKYQYGLIISCIIINGITKKLKMV